MRYQLWTLKPPAGDLGLTDEIALIRLTIQDLIDLLAVAPQAQRVALGSMLRDAIDSLSRVMERAARLPTDGNLSTQAVAVMLSDISAAIENQLPDGVARQQLIMNVKDKLEGISIREAPSVRVLRTCEMMDGSVPYVLEESAGAEPEEEEA